MDDYTAQEVVDALITGLTFNIEGFLQHEDCTLTGREIMEKLRLSGLSQYISFIAPSFSPLDVVEFFKHANVRDDSIVSTVQGEKEFLKVIAFKEESEVNFSSKEDFSDLIVKEKISTNVPVRGIFVIKKTFGLKKLIDLERKRIEKEFSKSEGESLVKGGKKKASPSPKPKKAAKKVKKVAVKTLLRDSETVGSTSTPPKDAEVEGEVNQSKEIEKVDVVVETEVVEKDLAVESIPEKAAEVEAPAAEKIDESIKIISDVCKDIQEQDVEDEQAIGAQDHSLPSKDPEVKEMEVDEEPEKKDVDISAEIARFNSMALMEA
ncbi:hypothetical protein Dimus_029274 [Dionaea muscipula]